MLIRNIKVKCPRCRYTNSMDGWDTKFNKCIHFLCSNCQAVFGLVDFRDPLRCLSCTSFDCSLNGVVMIREDGTTISQSSHKE